LTIDGEIIHTTDEHPFYVRDKAWVEAGELTVGTEILKSDGSFGLVEAVIVLDEPQTMYNLTVALAHTFVVGEQGWVVHNVDFNADKYPRIRQYSYNPYRNWAYDFDISKIYQQLIRPSGNSFQLSSANLPGSAGLRINRGLIVPEMGSLTARHNLEFGLALEFNRHNQQFGQYWLFSGSTVTDRSGKIINYVNISDYAPNNPDLDLIEIYHSHPINGRRVPSAGDIDRLDYFYDTGNQVNAGLITLADENWTNQWYWATQCKR
jgi:pretoxin HINT domain-containing protein